MIAQRAGRTTRQDLRPALFYNLTAAPPAIAGTVTPLIAAIAMSPSPLPAISNALGLLAFAALPVGSAP
jgi:Cu2+-exporting ATPase